MAISGVDLALWEIGYGIESGAVHSDGDADGDFAVDGVDFLIWQRQFGFPLSPVIGSASTSPVPEPTGFTLLSLALVLVAANRSTR